MTLIRRAQRLAIAALAAAAPACGSALAESRLDGLWSLDPEWCGNDPGQTDHVPMAISLPSLLTHDSECEVQALEPLGIQPAAWRADMLCRAGSGERVPTSAILALGRYHDGTVDHLVRIDFDDTRVLFYRRCP